MPNLVPHKSGVHRFACCVLYRRLLQHTNRIPKLEASQIILTKAIIKAKFRRNAKLQAFQRIISELQLGYRALRVFIALDKSQSPEPTTRFRDFLSHQISIGTLPKLIQASPTLSAQSSRRDSVVCSSVVPATKAENTFNPTGTPSPKQTIKKAPSRRLRRTPNPYPIFARPYPSLSGRRRLPRLISANGIPFLRIKKPQPAILSRMIRCTIEQRNAMNARMARFADEERIAAEEDRWDAIIDRELQGDARRPRNPVRDFGRGRGTKWGGESNTRTERKVECQDGEERWTKEIQRALREEGDRMHTSNLKRSATAKRMWEIVKAEKALLEQERSEKKQIQAKRRRIRKKSDEGRQDTADEVKFSGA